MLYNACWACSLGSGDLSEHKSYWFYQGPDGVVVEDLNPGCHDLRLLYMPRDHVQCGSETEEMIAIATRLLYGIARAIVVERNYKIVRLSLHGHSYNKHWHAQLSLDRRAK